MVFVRRDASSLFASLHFPRGKPREGIVICSSINADHSKLYGAEVRLGAALATEGFAVIRFHYRGQGHSDGDASDVTFESLRDDALAATEYLQSEADVPGVSFIGSRMGALVAGAVAGGYADSRLVLWEPIVDPVRYVREAQRSMSISRMQRYWIRLDGGRSSGIRRRWLGRHTWIPHLQTSRVESGREGVDPRRRPAGVAACPDITTSGTLRFIRGAHGEVATRRAKRRHVLRYRRDRLVASRHASGTRRDRISDRGGHLGHG